MLKESLRKYHSTEIERCGVITVHGEIVEYPNVHPNPRDYFQMEMDQIHDLAASWHTHRGTNFNLSLHDYRTFIHFPTMCHYIISESEVKCYRMDNGLLISDDDYNPLIRDT